MKRTSAYKMSKTVKVMLAQQPKQRLGACRQAMIDAELASRVVINKRSNQTDGQ